MDSNMTMEILSRCSIDTLDQCKLVCKQWNILTHESSFIQLHSERTRTISGYFIQGMRNCKFVFKFVSMNDGSGNPKNISLDFLPNDVQLLAASDQGLLCFMRHRYKNSRFHICKPATQQLLALPNPRLRYRTEKVALVVLGSNPLRYKIIRLSEPRERLRDDYNYHCEVFDSDIWAWKRKDDILLPNGVFLLGSAISACGTTYWLTNEDSLLIFDERLEKCRDVFPLGICENDNYDGLKKLCKYEGQLAFIWEMRKDVYEIWVNKNDWWQKRVVMDMEVLKKENPFCCPRPIAFSSVDIALLTKGNYDVQFYKFPHKVLKKECFASSISDVLAFRSDFEQADLITRGKILKSDFLIFGFLKKFAGLFCSILRCLLDIVKNIF